jgi:hypothetical protein
LRILLVNVPAYSFEGNIANAADIVCQVPKHWFPVKILIWSANSLCNHLELADFKLLISVKMLREGWMPARRCTSQECSKCSHTHSDNRRSQALFVCQNCGFAEDADTNAAVVIKELGISMLVTGEITVKQKKGTMRLEKKAVLGQELSKAMRGEKDVRQGVGDTCISQPSVNHETPTTTAMAV